MNSKQNAGLAKHTCRSLGRSFGVVVSGLTGLVFGLVLISESAMANDIFVRPVRGVARDATQLANVTDLVKSAVQALPEHTLATSESSAELVLQPRIIDREGNETLRLESYKNGTLLSSSEETLSSIETGRQGAYTLTQHVLRSDAATTPPTSSADTDRTPLNPVVAAQDAKQAAATDTRTKSRNELMPTSSQQQSSPAAQGAWRTSPQTNAQTNAQASSRANAQDSQSAQATPPERNLAAARYDRPAGDVTSADNSRTESLRSDNRDYTAPGAQPVVDSTPAAGSAQPVAAAADSSAGESRAIAPRHSKLGGPGYFSAGLGAGFGSGMNSTGTLYDINGAYNFDISPEWAAKGFLDLNLGSGSDVSRFIDVAAGGNWYPQQLQFANSRPYLTADVGLGFVRNSYNEGTQGLATGLGAGFQFDVASLSVDVNAHYTLLMASLRGTTPQVMGLRLAVNF